MANIIILALASVLVATTGYKVFEDIHNATPKDMGYFYDSLFILLFTLIFVRIRGF